MKKKLIYFIFATLLVQVCFAQDKNQIINKEGVLYQGEKMFSGTFEEKYESGKLLSAITINNGFKHGDATYYYENGKIKEAGKYANNKIDGTWKKWSSEGKLVGLANYKAGVKDGVWEIWDESGIKRFDMLYKDGEKIGVWKMWNETGKLIQEKEY